MYKFEGLGTRYLVYPIMQRGAKSLYNGLTYETKLKDALKMLSFYDYPISVLETTAGASKESDIRFEINGAHYSIEAKDKKAFEGGQKRLIPGPNGLFIPEECLHKECLGSLIPYNGNIPSFLKGDTRREQWDQEKHLFPDLYIPVEPTKVTEYYRNKGDSYIHLEGKGLYHLGHDVLNLGVPLFTCTTELRIRSKQHKSVPMHRSITSSFVFDTKKLPNSPYDLVTNPPPVFKKKQLVESTVLMTSSTCSSHMTMMEIESDIQNTTL